MVLMSGMRRTLRRAASLAVPAVAGWLVLACVTPSDAFDDYLNRTASIRGPGSRSGDAGPIDAMVPLQPFTATYTVACLPSISTAANALRFVDTVSFMPGDGGGATFTVTFNPLANGSTDNSMTDGPPIGPNTGTIDAMGNFSVDVKNIVIPASADPLMLGQVEFMPDTQVVGVLATPDKFCAGLDGNVTKPNPIPLHHCADICLFQKIDGPSAPLPPYTDTDYVCPGLPGCM
jgi:hypothetical protein